MSVRRSLSPSIIAEMIFASYPMLAVILFLLWREKPGEILASPEWSFAAAMLSGQAVVRLATGLLGQSHVRRGEVGLIFSLVLAFCFAPSNMFLWMILGSSEQHPAKIWIKIGQLLLFAMASTVYVVFGSISVPKEQSEAGKSSE